MIGLFLILFGFPTVICTVILLCREKEHPYYEAHRLKSQLEVERLQRQLEEERKMK